MSSSLEQEVCPKCESAYVDGHCSNCDLIVARPAVQEQILDQRLPILILLFGVMGVLGLPLLWLSPAFCRRTKVVLSVVVVLYTGLLLTAAYFASRFAWQSWLEFANR